MSDRLRRAWSSRESHEDDRLSALLDDELPLDEAIEVTRHVASCASCFEELDALRRLRAELRALPSVDPPAELYLGMPARLAEVQATRRRRGLWLAFALASAAFTVAAASATDPADGRTVSPPVEVFVADHLARTETGPALRPVDLGR
jgi:anti-sigma factor RsiW